MPTPFEFVRHLCALVPLVASCAGPRPVDVDALPSRADLPAFDTARLPESFADAHGFDALVSMDAPDALRAGDRLLYRVWVKDGERDEEWLLLVRLGEPDGQLTLRAEAEHEGNHRTFVQGSPAWRCEVLVAETAGGEIHRGQLHIPQLSMRANLFTAAAVLEELKEPDGEADPWPRIRAAMMGFASVAALFEGWQANATLAALLERVVGSPPFAAVLRGLVTFDTSFSVGIRGGSISDTVTLPAPVGELPAYRTPLQIVYAGHALLDLELLVVECAAPLSVGVGVVGFRGSHPSDGDRWVLVELLGARRGTGPGPADAAPGASAGAR